MKLPALRVLVAGGACLLAVSAAGARKVVVAPVPAVDTIVAFPAERRDVEIAFYAGRAARDPIGAADRSRLGALYLDRARAMGSYEDVKRAEAMARESLRLREAHNTATHALLASALMAQHRFAEALAAAERADAAEPGVVSYRALIGEIAAELGDYDRARAVFDSLRRESLSDAATLRLARWDELSGHVDWAERRFRAVLAEWQRDPGVSAGQRAWLHVRLAELAMKTARWGAADSAIAAGLRAKPGDDRLLGTAARLAAARGRWREAIDVGERAIANRMEPAVIAALSDAYAARGDSGRAAQCAAVMRTVAIGSSTPDFPLREWSLWMLDHALDVERVLHLARAQVRTRHDVYTYDLYAWALYKSGRFADARDAMRQALRIGTEDRLIERHAAEIMRSRS